jgi:hypothetical protein
VDPGQVVDGGDAFEGEPESLKRHIDPIMRRLLWGRHEVDAADFADGGDPLDVGRLGERRWVGLCVVGLAERVEGELAGTGVHVTTVMPSLANTELAAGLRPPRFVPLVEPGQVARAIARAIERPRLDVFVPPGPARSCACS